MRAVFYFFEEIEFYFLFAEFDRYSLRMAEQDVILRYFIIILLTIIDIPEVLKSKLRSF
jgi:hypothetical protein